MGILSIKKNSIDLASNLVSIFENNAFKTFRKKTQYLSILYSLCNSFETFVLSLINIHTYVFALLFFFRDIFVSIIISANSWSNFIIYSIFRQGNRVEIKSRLCNWCKRRMRIEIFTRFFDYDKVEKKLGWMVAKKFNVLQHIHFILWVKKSKNLFYFSLNKFTLDCLIVSIHDEWHILLSIHAVFKLNIFDYNLSCEILEKNQMQT